MAEYSRAEAAPRAGVDPGYIDRLIELRIITPGADDRLTKGDVRRAQMAQTLEMAVSMEPDGWWGRAAHARQASARGGAL